MGRNQLKINSYIASNTNNRWSVIQYFITLVRLVTSSRAFCSLRVHLVVFCNYCEKFENSKWPSFWVRQKLFENWGGYSAEILCGSKISTKSLYLAQFSRYKHFVFCYYCEKFENSKWPPFWVRQNFLKSGMATLQTYPVSQKFRRNCSISHSFRDISIFVFSLFAKFVIIN